MASNGMKGIVGMLGSLMGLYIVLSFMGRMPVFSGGEIVAGAPDFTIWRYEDTYYAKNAYGVVQFQGSDAVAVVHNAWGALNSTTGGTIRLVRGHYVFNENCMLNGKSNITIEGDGFNTWIDFTFSKDETEDAFAFCFWGDTPIYNIMIRDLSITGNYTGENNGNHGIEMRNVHNFVIENIRLKGIGEEGIFISHQSRDGLISNVIADGCEIGIELNYGSQRIIVENCISTNCITGFQAKGFNGEGDNQTIGVKFAHCIARDNSGRGFGIYNTTRVELLDCSSIGASVGVDLRWNAYATRIIGGVYSQCSGVSESVGIKISDNSDLTFITGAVIGANDYGIRIYGGCDDTRVINNNLQGNNQSYFGDADPIVRNNLGFVTENSGLHEGASGTYFAHGLAWTPDIVVLGVSGSSSYKTSYSANSTHITIYHDAGGSISVSWYAEYKP